MSAPSRTPWLGYGAPCANSGLCGQLPGWHPQRIESRLRESLHAGTTIGQPARLRRVLRTLREGREDITVTGIGASVTADFGGAVGWMQDRFSLGYSGLPSFVHGDDVKPGWMLPFADFLFSLGPAGASGASWLTASRNESDSEHGKVLVVNAGCAGHKLDSYMFCLATRVPPTTDLFLVDAATVPTNLREIEATLRGLLALPRRPAILLVNFANWCWPRPGLGPNDQITVNEARNRSCYTPQRLASSWQLASVTESIIDTTASYYALPSFSFRRAFGPAALRAARDPFFRPWELTKDGLHPTRHGARGQACRTTDMGCEGERYAQLAAVGVSSLIWRVWKDMGEEEAQARRKVADAAVVAHAAHVGTCATYCTSSCCSFSNPEAECAGCDAAYVCNPTAACYSGKGGSGGTARAESDASGAFQMPCVPLHPRLAALAAAGGEQQSASLEKCFAWGPNLKPRAEKSAAPLLNGSDGFSFTEFDTAIAADARDLCRKESERRRQKLSTDDTKESTLPSDTGSTDERAAKAKAAKAKVKAEKAGRGLKAEATGGGDAANGSDAQMKRVHDAGLDRHGTWSEGICIKKLRLKSRPGLTAFAPHSLALILLSLGTSDSPTDGSEAAAEDEARAPRLPSLPSPPVARTAEVGWQAAELTLTYLSSYEGMGMARLRCRRKCVCEPLVLDAHRGKEEAHMGISVYKTESVGLTLDARGRCVVELFVLNRTRSAGHKFKVSEAALVAHELVGAGHAAGSASGSGNTSSAYDCRR